MNKIVFTSLLGLSLLLCGCSNPQKATKSNFSKAIDEYMAYEKVCLPVNLALQNDQDNSSVFIGNQEIRIPMRNLVGSEINKNALEQMNILVGADLYRQDNNEQSQNSHIPIAVFQRTKNNHTTISNHLDAPLLCLGKQKVGKIILFTEPTSNNGMVTSEVIYDAIFIPEKWAEKLLKIRNDYWQKTLNQPLRESSTLVLTNEGWKDKRIIKY